MERRNPQEILLAELNRMLQAPATRDDPLPDYEYPECKQIFDTAKEHCARYANELARALAPYGDISVTSSPGAVALWYKQTRVAELQVQVFGTTVVIMQRCIAEWMSTASLAHVDLGAVPTATHHFPKAEAADAKTADLPRVVEPGPIECIDFAFRRFAHSAGQLLGRMLRQGT